VEKRPGGPAKPRAKPTRKQPKQRVAQPLESAEKKPGLGAKWACFSCGAKFYDLNRPDPICPKCQTDQREQPAKTAPVVSPPARNCPKCQTDQREQPAKTAPVISPPVKKRPAAAPITRLLDEEEASEPAFEEDSDAEGAAELDIEKFADGERFLDDTEVSEDTDD
jgi:hypothetical protein